jgi:hypothetical protein
MIILFFNFLKKLEKRFCWATTTLIIHTIVGSKEVEFV